MSVHGPLGATPRSGAFGLSRAGLDSRATSSAARRGTIALAGLLASGLVISVAAARTENLLPESARPVPRWLAGPFGSASLNLHPGGLIAVLALMLACYLVAVHSAARLSARAVLMTIAGLHALVLLAPPLLSTDVFSYQAYARMGAIYGANPYLNGPHVIALDPLYPFIAAKWVTTPTAYGPVFTTLSYGLAPLSIAASAVSYKAIAALASLTTVAFVWNSARLRGMDPVRAGALVGLNPLIVVYGVGGGHNDLLMLALMAAAVYLLLAQRERLGGALAGLAVGVKLTAALLAPFAIAGAARRRAGERRDVWVGVGTGTAVVVAIGFGVFGTGPLHLVSTVQQSQSQGDWHSIPGVISTRLGLVSIGHVVGWLLAAGFAAAVGWLARRVWRGELDWIDGAAWATVAMLITASSLLPWYVSWLMPLAALAADRRVVRAALALTAAIQCVQFLGYIPHGTLHGL